jgi:hypothetical protein
MGIYQHGVRTAQVLTGAMRPAHPWQMAEALRGMGIVPGDKVASVGHANDPPAGWARLARVKIIAEIYSTAVSRLDIKPGVEKDFWAADEAVRQCALAAFAKAGAKAVVVWKPPSWAPKDGWQQVGDTGYACIFRGRQTNFYQEAGVYLRRHPAMKWSSLMHQRKHAIY